MPRGERIAARLELPEDEHYLALSDMTVHSRIPPEVIDNRVTARTSAEGFRTELFANGFPLVADEPVKYGGGSEGPSPYEYLLAALGACTGMTLQMYARNKRWPLEDVVVRLSHHKVHAKDCLDCDDIDRRIDTFERELDEEQRQRLLEIAGHCPIHRTLLGDVRIETTLKAYRETVDELTGKQLTKLVSMIVLGKSRLNKCCQLLEIRFQNCTG